MAGAPPWIDVPEGRYHKLARFEDERFDKLDVLIARYHCYEKTLQENLSARIQALEGIIHYIESWLTQETQKPKLAFLENIQKIASNKKAYLEKIRELYFYHLDDPIILKNKYRPDLTNIDQKPLYLVNKRFYDSKNGMYWGEHYLEVLDPCHRQLTTYHDLWKALKEADPNTSPFFLWLEKQNLSKDISYVKYLTSAEIEQCRIISIDHCLYFAHDLTHAIHLEQGEKEYIFIIDLNKNIYLIEGSSIIHHTSLSHGLPVLGAGNMMIINGSIDSIAFASGHYLPEIQDDLQTIQILIEQKIPFSENPTVTFFHQLEMWTTDLHTFLQKAAK